MKTTVRALRKMMESATKLTQFMAVNPEAHSKVNDPNVKDTDIIELPDEAIEWLKFRIAFEPKKGENLAEKEFDEYLKEKFKSVGEVPKAQGLPKSLQDLQFPAGYLLDVAEE